MSGADSADRVALPRRGGEISARDRAGECGARALSRPVVHRGAHERDERLALQTDERRQPLGRALDRDEEVGGERGGGVIERALLARDEPHVHAEPARECARGVERRVAAAVDRAVGAGEGRADADHAEQRMHREALVRREEIERGRRAHVADDRARLDDGGGRGDLAIGDADQDDVGSGARLAAPERPVHLGSGLTECGGERGPHASAADDGDRGHAGNLLPKASGVTMLAVATTLAGQTLRQWGQTPRCLSAQGS